ncbi:2Fe-2S iron-sulfur cluster-binding protein [Flammeovirga aprica]|uniref:2Fe-2S iron-sulfur cluster binding domain-containing protein n=1 Tax=Flammeovirga aprica JL-4 TaxID=694437 RepID=A0A7X9RUB2_9BACT|nr:2Fe-2S iron-sulfur cluster-binding protein [Flammeovirga aprica]NME68843.1 2Fe-2S iron-sulfur cluster binding domain-containing protein [Flammeovirga aprica JL-4]
MEYLMIDEEKVDISDKDKTLVDTIRRCKKSITAPCYKTMRKFGTCNSCLVEIDGEKKLACGNSPEPNQCITLNRNDLTQERKKKVVAFKKHVEMMEKYM